MPRTIETIVYKFEELTDELKEKVLAKYWDIIVDYDWWDYTYEDAKTLGEKMGFQIDKINFSGFCSQGDGACFFGTFKPIADCLAAITDDTTHDSTLSDIARDLTKLILSHGVDWSAKFTTHGRYSHSGTMRVELDAPDDMSQEEFTALEKGILQTAREFADWIYSRLEKEYDYLTSATASADFLIANDYEFNGCGEMV